MLLACCAGSGWECYIEMNKMNAQQMGFAVLGALFGAALSLVAAHFEPSEFTSAHVISSSLISGFGGYKFASIPPHHRSAAIVQILSVAALTISMWWLVGRVWPFNGDCNLFICLIHQVLALGLGIAAYVWLRVKLIAPR